MKKNIIFSSVIITVLSFFFMMPHFNNEVNYNSAYMHHYINNGQYVMMISIADTSSVSEADPREFHQNLEDCAIKNNFVIAQGVVDNSSDSRKEILFLSKNDLYAKDAFMLEEGTLSLESNQRYSTNSQNKGTKLANLFIPTIYEVDSLVNSYNNASGYSFASIEGDIEQNLVNFVKDMDTLYPGIEIHNAKTFTESFSKDTVDNLYAIKILCVLIIVLLISTKLYSMQKLISLYKIEGYSDFKIMVTLFMRYFILCNVFAYILSTVCFSLYFRSWLTFITILKLFSKQFILLVAMELVVSFIIYLIIRYTPKVNAMKGKNELPKIQFSAYILKVIVIMIAIPIINNRFLPSVDFIKMNIRYDSVIDKLENYYNFGAHIDSKYHLDRGSDNYISLKDDLIKNNNLFDLTKGAYYDFENFDPNEIDYFYIVNSSYLKLIGLADETFNENEISIYTRPDIIYDMEVLVNDLRKNNPDNPNINYINYDYDLRSYDARELLFKDNIENIPIVYMPEEKRFQGQLNLSKFYYDDENRTAQEYIDYMFKMHGYTRGFLVDSLANNYAGVFQTYIGASIQSFMQFVIALFAIITAVLFLFNIDYDNNKKRYMISWIEGVHVYKFNLYFIKFVSASIMGFILAIMLVPKILNKELFGSAIFILLLELIMYGVFVYRCRKR